jgi:pectinesterase
VKVAEVKRFTVDAGHNFDQLDSTFTFEGPPDITVAIGLNKNAADKGQDAKTEVGQSQADGILSQWIVQKSNGSLGTAVILPLSTLQGFAEDASNQLALTKAKSGTPVRYYVGAGWTRSGQFPTKESWDAYVADCAKRANSPVRVQFGP